MRIERVFDEEGNLLSVNVYADEGKVFVRKSTGERLGTGKCNHLVLEDEKEIEKYIEVER